MNNIAQSAFNKVINLREKAKKTAVKYPITTALGCLSLAFAAGGIVGLVAGSGKVLLGGFIGSLVTGTATWLSAQNATAARRNRRAHGIRPNISAHQHYGLK